MAPKGGGAQRAQERLDRVPRYAVLLVEAIGLVETRSVVLLLSRNPYFELGLAVLVDEEGNAGVSHRLHRQALKGAWFGNEGWRCFTPSMCKECRWLSHWGFVAM